MKILFIIVLAMFAAQAQAQYRCNVRGAVVFQEQPCVPQRKTTDLEKMTASELQAHFEKSKQPVEQQPPGYELHVPSDYGATYVVLEVINVPPDGRLREILTKRIGRGGHIGYSRRLFDCRYRQVKYLGAGDTLVAVEKSKPDANLAVIVPGSIADYVGKEACKGYY